jgi:hypothetical protein
LRNSGHVAPNKTLQRFSARPPLRSSAGSAALARHHAD